MGFLDIQTQKGLVFGIGVPSFLFGILFLVFDMQDNGIKGPLLSGIAALCALPNLFIFFKALRENKDTRANGVLVSTILWALFTFGLKLFA